MFSGRGAVAFRPGAPRWGGSPISAGAARPVPDWGESALSALGRDFLRVWVPVLGVGDVMVVRGMTRVMRGLWPGSVMPAVSGAPRGGILGAGEPATFGSRSRVGVCVSGLDVEARGTLFSVFQGACHQRVWWWRHTGPILRGNCNV